MISSRLKELALMTNFDLYLQAADSIETQKLGRVALHAQSAIRPVGDLVQMSGNLFALSVDVAGLLASDEVAEAKFREEVYHLWVASQN